MTRPLRVAVVSRHELIRAGLAQLLGADADRATVLLPASGTHEVPDVIVYDLAGPDSADDDTLLQLVGSSLPVVALQPSSRRDQAESALAMGAAHVVSMDVTGSALLDVVEEAAAGRRTSSASVRAAARAAARAQAGLTDRELAVLELIAAGLSNDQIAAALYITINTVKSYVRTAYKRIGATNRPMAVLWTLERGLGPVARVPATSASGAA